MLKDFRVQLVLGDLAGIFIKLSVYTYQIRDIGNSSLKTGQTELR